MEIPVSHIEIRDDEKAYVKGRNLKVKMVAERVIKGGLSVEDTADHYGLSLSDVYATLAYYYDNRDAFAAEDAEVQSLIEKSKEESAARLKAMQGRSKSQD